MQLSLLLLLFGASLCRAVTVGNTTYPTSIKNGQVLPISWTDPANKTAFSGGNLNYVVYFWNYYTCCNSSSVIAGPSTNQFNLNWTVSVPNDTQQLVFGIHRSTESDAFFDNGPNNNYNAPTILIDGSISSTPASNDSHSSIGPIIGGVVGGVVIIFLVLGLVFFLRRRKRQQRTAQETIDLSYHDNNYGVDDSAFPTPYNLGGPSGSENGAAYLLNEHGAYGGTSMTSPGSVSSFPTEQTATYRSGHTRQTSDSGNSANTPDYMSSSFAANAGPYASTSQSSSSSSSSSSRPAQMYVAGDHEGWLESGEKSAKLKAVEEEAEADPERDVIPPPAYYASHKD